MDTSSRKLENDKTNERLVCWHCRQDCLLTAGFTRSSISHYYRNCECVYSVVWGVFEKLTCVFGNDHQREKSLSVLLL